MLSCAISVGCGTLVLSRCGLLTIEVFTAGACYPECKKVCAGADTGGVLNRLAHAISSEMFERYSRVFTGPAINGRLEVLKWARENVTVTNY